MISIIDQIKYSIYFILFGIFIGAYFDYAKIITGFIDNKTTKIFKNKVISKIIVYLIQSLILGFLIHISLEYTFKVSNGYAPIHITIFFLGGYLIYFYCLKKDNHKNLFILSYFSYKFRLKEKLKYVFKNLIINTEILNKIKKVFKKIILKLRKNKDKNENCDIIIPEN